MPVGTLRKRIEYFDFLRILATVAVIMLHVSTQNWYNTDIKTYAWQIYNGFNSSTRWAVPVFLMVSGALFLDGTRKIEVILKKNVLRMMTAFVFWSAVYIIYSYREVDRFSVNIVMDFVEGHFHMWFLYAISGLYLAVPILRTVVESDKVRSYFLILALVFSVLIPNIAAVIGVRIETGVYILGGILNQLQIPAITVYAFYFVLGYYLNNTEIPQIWRKRIYVLGIFGLLTTIVISSAASLLKQTPVSDFYECNTVNVLFMSTAVFVYAKYHFSYGKLSEKGIAVMRKLSKYSFGAYLAHMLVIYVLDSLFSYQIIGENPLITIPVKCLIVSCISFAVSGMLNHIPVLKKYIV